MLADEVDYVIGVDTHRDQHVLAVVVASSGGVLAQRVVRSKAHGYAKAMRFASDHAPGARIWAVEPGRPLRRRLRSLPEQPRRDGARGRSYCSWRAAAAGRAARGFAPALARATQRRRRAPHRDRPAPQRDRDRAGELARRATTATAGRAAAASAARAHGHPISSRSSSCCAHSHAASRRQPKRRASSSGRSSATSAHSCPTCSTRQASARSSRHN
jgi:hypothetical protein